MHAYKLLEGEANAVRILGNCAVHALRNGALTGSESSASLRTTKIIRRRARLRAPILVAVLLRAQLVHETPRGLQAA